MNCRVPLSVLKRNLAVTFTPVGAQQQPSNRSGFPSGSFGRSAKSSGSKHPRCIALSTESGFATQAVKFLDAEVFVRPRGLCRDACNFYATKGEVCSSLATHTPRDRFRFQGVAK
jgi:hypothetical protein